MAFAMTATLLSSCEEELERNLRQISIDPTELAFNSGSGSDTVNVTCTSEWSLTGEAEWCKASVNQGNGDAAVIFTVEPNTDSTSARNATFTFLCGDKEAVLTVTQEKMDYYISIDTTELVFSAAGGEDTVIVTCTAEWELTGDADWCKASAYQGTGDTSVIFIAEPNADTSGRSATFTFTSGGKEAVLTVTQAEKDYSISIDRTELKFGYKGGQLSIVVTSSDNWSLEGSSDWCKASSMSGNNGDSVVFTADPYDNLYENRSASFNFRCGNKTATLTVTQVDDSPIIKFKDPNFLKALLEPCQFEADNGKTYVVIIDKNGDGNISELEAAAVKGLNLNFMENKFITNQINNMDEISYFTELEYLDCCGNLMTDLDLSNNTKLTWLICHDGQLEFLDISNSTNLEYLSCGGNQLTSLNISRNTALSSLFCEFNPIGSLDLSNNLRLETLRCDNCQLSSLDLKNNAALIYLDCSNNTLDRLDISKNTGLVHLYCTNNKLTELNTDNNTNLEFLNCDNNTLTAIDVSKNTKITFLSCLLNKIKTIDTEKNIALKELYCSDNEIESLDLSKNTSLTTLQCAQNSLRELDLRSNTMLNILWCSNNNLTSIDLSENINLTKLECFGNDLKEIILPANGTYNEQLIQMVLDSDGNYSPDMFKTK